MRLPATITPSWHCRLGIPFGCRTSVLETTLRRRRRRHRGRRRWLGLQLLFRLRPAIANLRHEPDLLLHQIRFMSEVRDCWAEAEKQLKPKPSAPATMAAPPPSQGGFEDGGPTAEWNA